MKDDLGVSRLGRINVRKSAIQMSLMRWAGYQTEQGNASYAYHFEHELPGDTAGAFHSGELWYVFGTLRRSRRPFSAADEALSERMTDLWTAFIKTGDPGWEACSGEKGFYYPINIEEA